MTGGVCFGWSPLAPWSSALCLPLQSPPGKMWPARLLLPLYSIILGSALSDTAELRARLGPNLFYTFSMTLCLPWGCPAASSARCRQALRQGRSDTNRGPGGGEGARRARSGGAPRRCPEGRAFIPGVASRELPFGSARAAAGGGAGLRGAALQPGPGRGRWMPRLRWCCLPGRLRRSVSAGRRGRPPAGPGGAAGRARAGKAGGRRGPPAPALPVSPESSGPDSRLRLWSRRRRRSLAPESGGDREGRGGRTPAPLACWGVGGWGEPGAGKQGRVAFSLGGFGARGSPCGPKPRGGGCSLGRTGFSEPGPGPPDGPTQRGSGRRPGRRAPPPSPLSLPAAFTLSLPGRQRAALEGAAARQLAKQWRPRFPGPPPLGTEDGGGWVHGKLGR